MYIIYITAQLLLWHVFFCVFCWSSSCVLCAQYRKCHWIVYFWFAIRVSLRFIKHWRNVNSKWMNCLSLCLVLKLSDWGVGVATLSNYELMKGVSKVYDRGVGAVTLSNYELMKWSVGSVWLWWLPFPTPCNYSINKTPAVNYVILMSRQKWCQMNHTCREPPIPSTSSFQN